MASPRLLALPLLAALLLAAAGPASASVGRRALRQYAVAAPLDKPLPNIHNQIAELKAKHKFAPVTPIAVVSNAQYVQPALAISNEPQFVAPLAVAPGPSLLQRARAYFARPAAVAPAVAAPILSAVPAAPVYASGAAFPTPGGVPFGPVSPPARPSSCSALFAPCS